MKCNTESRTETFGLVWDYIPKISGILVWDRDFFSLVWDFWDFFPALQSLMWAYPLLFDCVGTGYSGGFSL